MAFVQEKTAGFAVKGARAATLPAGPFEVSRAQDEQKMSAGDALLTGLLVIYPVIAIVAAVILGMHFAGPVV